MTDRPIIRLKPKVNPQKLRHGFPWVYDNEMVTDRRTRGIAPGSLAILTDHAKNELGLFAVNPNSKIIARRVDGAVDAVLNADWFEGKLRAALKTRARLYADPYYRLIHAEADGLPGLIIDRFDYVFVVQPNAAWVDRLLPELVQALKSCFDPKAVVMNGMGRARSLEGLDEARRMLLGDKPSAPLTVPMNGATYMADLAEGQKTGLFYDQRPNHAFVQRFCEDKDVLDVFCHVGGFGLAGLAAGAKSAAFVDGSATALNLAQQGADHTNANANCEFIKSDAFTALEKFGAEDRKFDVVVCDPPAFAPNKSARDAGLRAYERVAKLAAPLVGEGGVLTLCSCSHAADLDLFRAACVRGIGRAGRKAQLIYTGSAGPDHPHHMLLAETSYLKSLVFVMQ